MRINPVSFGNLKVRGEKIAQAELIPHVVTEEGPQRGQRIFYVQKGRQPKNSTQPHFNVYMIGNSVSGVTEFLDRDGRVDYKLTQNVTDTLTRCDTVIINDRSKGVFKLPHSNP